MSVTAQEVSKWGFPDGAAVSCYFPDTYLMDGFDVRYSYSTPSSSLWWDLSLSATFMVDLLLQQCNVLISWTDIRNFKVVSLDDEGNQVALAFSIQYAI